MRILTWNVNGIRTLPQYHPWNSLKTSNAILDELKADIICFQEMKTQRNTLPKYFSLPRKYEAFLSLPVNKGGYSGVAVYSKARSVLPLKAEEGLTGKLQPKPPLDDTERISPSYPQLADLNIYPEDDDGSKLTNLTELDSEGRTLILDFGLFVLINVYCPAETSDTRLPYKMNFHALLQERVRKLIEEEKREVMVVGDINITAAPIDHCDGNLPSNLASFWERPPRAWFKNWLAPIGPMVDVVRKSWPDRKGMYTCWNTRISAREVNYGTRVDYILVTEGLLPWVRFGDIQPAIKGSDHCPVYVDLHEEIRLGSGETLTLKDAMQYEQAKKRTPRIAARFWDEYKQKNLSSFFMSRKNEYSSTSSESSPSTTPPEDVQKTLSTAIQTSTSTSIEFEKTESSIPSSSMESSSVLTQKTSSRTIVKQQGTKRGREDQPDTSKKTQKKKPKTGQAKISSFFLKDNGKQPSSSFLSVPSSSELAMADNEIIDIDEVEESIGIGDERQIEEDRLLALQLSQSPEESLPSMMISPSATPSSNSQSKIAWSEMLAPIQPPNCNIHNEPCKEYTVNKPGPNKGKTFFLCSRPVGPGYDKGRAERLREEVDTRYRCNYFRWTNDVRKESHSQKPKR